MQAKKENDHVYFQRVPAESPALPQPRKVIPDTGSYMLPAPHPIVSELRAPKAFSAEPIPERELPAPTTTNGQSQPLSPAAASEGPKVPAKAQGMHV